MTSSLFGKSKLNKGRREQISLVGAGTIGHNMSFDIGSNVVNWANEFK